MTRTFTVDEITDWLEESEATVLVEYYEFGEEDFEAEHHQVDEEGLNRFREFELGEFKFEFIVSYSGIYMYSLVLHHTSTDTWWKRSVIFQSQDYEWLEGEEDPWDERWVRVVPEEKTVLVFDTVADD